MRAALAHGGDGATADAWIDHPGPFDFQPWLNDVAHWPDAHRFPRRGNLQVSAGNPHVTVYRCQHGLFIHLQMAIVVARGRRKA